VPSLYPVYLDLHGRPCLVVGAGEVAWRKARALLEAGAHLTVVAPSACAPLRAAGGRGDLTLIEEEFGPKHLDGVFLCVVATDRPEVNRAAADEARRRGVLVNVVDAPELCDFQAPAVVRRGLFQIAVSSGGASPLLAARVRRELEGLYGPEYGALTDILLRVRAEVRGRAGAGSDSGSVPTGGAGGGSACDGGHGRDGDAGEGAARAGKRLKASVEAANSPFVRGLLAAGKVKAAERLVRRHAGLAPVRVGCRGSDLARRQAELVIEAMERAGGRARFEIVTISTGGDRDRTTPLDRLGSVGAFTSELERALTAGDIDLAVHSLKDLPTHIPPELTLAAVTERADPRDVLICREVAGLADLPPGSVVGTSSPRRAALLRRLRPDLECRPLRGNVDTRLRRLEEGAYDAVILAAAGLERLGLTGRATEFLDPVRFPPAPAQGFLAVEARVGDEQAVVLARLAEDSHARLAAEAERAFLRRLGIGCHAPAAALAEVDRSETNRVTLRIHGIVLSPDGRDVVEGRTEVDNPGPAGAAKAGARLAEELLGRSGLSRGLAHPHSGAPPGRVYLVGAGPGDPGLLTLKGADCLRRADCVVVDRLVKLSLLNLVRPGCEIVWAGKEPGRHGLSQDDISRLLAGRAREGLTVVRLKGGDPFVFGRGGEEAQFLRAAGVPYEVVPGVTSAVAGPAYAGIPVTHRGRARSVAFATGHVRAGDEQAPDLGELAARTDTLVVLMGTGRLEEIVDQIRRGGRSGDTPAAVIASATTADQRTVAGTLEEIAAKAREAGLVNPAVIVVGKVAALRSELAWSEDRPLAGRRIVVTRPLRQTSTIAEKLERLGADVFLFPAIRVTRPAQGDPETDELDRAIGRLDEFDWIVFTSVNGADVFFDRLGELGRDARCLAGCRVAAIGPATAARLASRGVRADLVPAEFRGEALAAALRQAAATSCGAGSADLVSPARRTAAPGSGRSVLLVRSDRGRRVVVAELERAGLAVEEVKVYRIEAEIDTPVRAALRDELAALLAEGRVDALTFASSATVRSFVEAVGRDSLDRGPVRPDVFCIGPVTADTARSLGLEVSGVPREYTIDGLVAEIVDFYKDSRR